MGNLSERENKLSKLQRMCPESADQIIFYTRYIDNELFMKLSSTDLLKLVRAMVQVAQDCV